jgi:sugar lactone lactonase YvrE
MTLPSGRPTSVLRRAVVALATLGLTAGIALVGADAASAAPTQRPRPVGPASIALPVGFQPEGIAIGGKRVYSGSRVTGDIYVASLRTGQGRILSKGPGTASLGLKVDGRRLWVAGGGGGNGRLVDTRNGRVVAAFTFTKNPSFVNDVVLAGRYAWFTDSLQAQLYRVDRKHPRRTPLTLPLTGAWAQTAGNNANGITTTPDGKALLVVQSSTGYLFRVQRTGVATRVDLGDQLLTNGDGLLRRGRTLYAVQNQLDRIAVVKLNRAGTAGTVRRTITSDAFDVPSTVAAFKGYLYLPNARFGAANPGTIAYSINRVRA